MPIDWSGGNISKQVASTAQDWPWTVGDISQEIVIIITASNLSSLRWNQCNEHTPDHPPSSMYKNILFRDLTWKQSSVKWLQTTWYSVTISNSIFFLSGAFLFLVVLPWFLTRIVCTYTHNYHRSEPLQSYKKTSLNLNMMNSLDIWPVDTYLKISR